MNFFGHAVTASWKNPDASFVLGAMLPDLANMIGAAPPSSDHSMLGAGLAFHLATDAVFHDAETFVELQREARVELADTGLRRGTRLAVAHVGVEMLIDAYLAQDGQGCDAYQRCLGPATDSVISRIRWRNPWQTLAFRSLRSRMQKRAESFRESLTPDVMARRLEGALSGRPLLEMHAGDALVVERWLFRFQPTVFARCPRLVLELRRELALDEPLVDARTAVTEAH